MVGAKRHLCHNDTSQGQERKEKERRGKEKERRGKEGGRRNLHTLIVSAGRENRHETIKFSMPICAH